MTAFPEFPADGHAFSAAEVGQALAGFVKRDSSGAPVAGMLTAPTIGAVASAWKVQVGRFVYVRNVGGAAHLSGLSSAEQVDIAPATGIPAGQSRIDAVGWDPSAAELVVVNGTPAVSPLAPGLGSLVLVCRVLVKAGDGMVVAGQVTSAFATTGLVSASGDTDWVQPSLQGGWVHEPGAPVKVRVRNGKLESQGRCNGQLSDGVMFVLPPGMRPATSQIRQLDRQAVGRFARVTITPEGVVSHAGSTPGTVASAMVAFSDLTFPVA